jgi:hypothetical protein
MRRPEQQLQRTVLRHLEVRAARSTYWFHVGNGGWRSPAEAKVFKSLGVRPGVPDLILIHQGRTFGLEIKADGGKLTPVQATAHVLMRDAGAEVEVAEGIDAALDQLERWGLLGGKHSEPLALRYPTRPAARPLASRGGRVRRISEGERLTVFAP